MLPRGRAWRVGRSPCHHQPRLAANRPFIKADAHTAGQEKAVIHQAGNARERHRVLTAESPPLRAYGDVLAIGEMRRVHRNGHGHSLLDPVDVAINLVDTKQLADGCRGEVPRGIGGHDLQRSRLCRLAFRGSEAWHRVGVRAAAKRDLVSSRSGRAIADGSGILERRSRAVPDSGSAGRRGVGSLPESRGALKCSN
ncbi:effector protein Tle3 domain-containing protein [Ancylobacter novellus]|uniref:effector protein Tle3 domain-containing protein n=1 Tax=Ancylobacter novellus TaxID=921 RepID=UPI003AA954A7